MTPLVMDTGVLVAGLYWHNEPHQCLRAWQRGVFHLAVSDAVFEEYRRVAWRVKEDERLRGVVYAQGLFAAVGYHGTVLTSKDGVTWTGRSSASEDRLQGIDYGNGLFMAVGWHGLILTSKDGIYWRTRSSVKEDVEHIAYKNGAFVTSGHSGARRSSTDGERWAPEESPTEFLASTAPGSKSGW